MCLGSTDFAAAAAGLKVLILAGEALTAHLLASFAAVSGAAVVNLYGPTEAAVYVTAARRTLPGASPSANRYPTAACTSSTGWTARSSPPPGRALSRGRMPFSGLRGRRGEDRRLLRARSLRPRRKDVPQRGHRPPAPLGRDRILRPTRRADQAQRPARGAGRNRRRALNAGAAQAVTIAVPGADGSLPCALS